MEQKGEGVGYFWEQERDLNPRFSGHEPDVLTSALSCYEL